MKQQTISQAYALGISEGRALLKENPGFTRADMQRCMENASDCMRTHGGDMREAFKGQRDFWKNQIKKKD